MPIKTLDELREPDLRTLAFLPSGLGIGIQMVPEDSAAHWQEVVARFELSENVAEQTRRSFKDLKKAFAYGLFCYELFTLVNDRALFVLEQALRDRFVEYHAGTVTFSVEGSPVDISVDRYEQVFEFLRRHKRSRPRPRLVVVTKAGAATMPFDGMLDTLRAWARRAGLLKGQRSQVVEDAIVAMRNAAAHPNGYHLGMPVDTARTLSNLSEIINHLWGQATPGGRLYPAPLTRDTVVLAWNEHTASTGATLAENFAEDYNWDEYTHFALVQAVWFDPAADATFDLSRYDSRYETGPYPTDYLWGPGSRADALAWLQGQPPTADTASMLDRSFVVRVHDGLIWLPMRPATVAALPPGNREGHWYLVGADTPNQAFAHVRTLLSDTGTCKPWKTCPACHAETLAHGKRATVLATAGVAATQATQLPPAFHLPGPGGGIQSIRL
jgi:hypothetical protein